MADLQIIQYVKAGNVSALKKCSKKDLSKVDESGWCAVHWAAWSGNKEAVLAILNKRLGHAGLPSNARGGVQCAASRPGECCTSACCSYAIAHTRNRS